MDFAAPGAALGDVARQRDDAGAEIRELGVGMPCCERGAAADVAVGAYVSVVDRQRIAAAQRTRERNRIVVDAVAGADDGLVAQAISQADARSEQLVADRDAGVFRNVAAAAQIDQVGGRIVAFDALAGSASSADRTRSAGRG